MTASKKPAPPASVPAKPPKPSVKLEATPAPEEEVGGRGGPDPTRYGDWEKNGRCIDF